MELMTVQVRRALPLLGSQDGKGGDAVVTVKYFTPDSSWTWYATEFDGEDTFFGLVDGLMSRTELRDHLIGQVGSDPDKPDTFNSVDMFEYLASHVAYFHGKDRRLNAAQGTTLGDGDVDWPRFFALYRRFTPDVPFVLEYVNAGNVLEVRDRALRLWKSADE